MKTIKIIPAKEAGYYTNSNWWVVVVDTTYYKVCETLGEARRIKRRLLI